MSHHQRQDAGFAAACRACGVEQGVDSANGLVEFYRRHSRQTGHDVVVTRTDFEFELPAATDIETVVAELEAHYENGVPLGAVAAAMSEQGIPIGETLDELHDVRLTGALYEPCDDHVAVV